MTIGSPTYVMRLLIVCSTGDSIKRFFDCIEVSDFTNIFINCLRHKINYLHHKKNVVLIAKKYVFGGKLTIKIRFTKEDIDELNYKRYHYPHPKFKKEWKLFL